MGATSQGNSRQASRTNCCLATTSPKPASERKSARGPNPVSGAVRSSRGSLGRLGRAGSPTEVVWRSSLARGTETDSPWRRDEWSGFVRPRAAAAAAATQPPNLDATRSQDLGLDESALLSPRPGRTGLSLVGAGTYSPGAWALRARPAGVLLLALCGGCCPGQDRPGDYCSRHGSRSGRGALCCPIVVGRSARSARQATRCLTAQTEFGTAIVARWSPEQPVKNCYILVFCERKESVRARGDAAKKNYSPVAGQVRADHFLPLLWLMSGRNSLRAEQGPRTTRAGPGRGARVRKTGNATGQGCDGRWCKKVGHLGHGARILERANSCLGKASESPPVLQTKQGPLCRNRRRPTQSRQPGPSAIISCSCRGGLRSTVVGPRLQIESRDCVAVDCPQEPMGAIGNLMEAAAPGLADHMGSGGAFTYQQPIGAFRRQGTSHPIGYSSRTNHCSLLIRSSVAAEDPSGEELSRVLGTPDRYSRVVAGAQGSKAMCSEGFPSSPRQRKRQGTTGLEPFKRVEG